MPDILDLASGEACGRFVVTEQRGPSCGNPRSDSAAAERSPQRCRFSPPHRGAPSPADRRTRSLVARHPKRRRVLGLPNPMCPIGAPAHWREAASLATCRSTVDETAGNKTRGRECLCLRWCPQCPGCRRSCWLAPGPGNLDQDVLERSMLRNSRLLSQRRGGPDGLATRASNARS
jgi:hypothetical protein